MEIRQLNTFLKLASVLNFTQAGRELGYSQPNISLQIQQLEQEIGAPLFNRIGRNISLTQYGEELLPYARQIVATAAEMENYFKAEEELGGTLRFGIADSLNAWILDRVFAAYHRRFPNVKLEVSADTSAVLKNNLERGLLDAVCLLDDPLPADKWDCRYRVAMPVVIVAGRSHPLTQRKDLQLRDLQEEEFILTEDTELYTSCFAEQGIPFRPVAKVPSAYMACKMVCLDGFMSILPLCNVKSSKYHEELTVLNVTDFCQTRYVQAICHAQKILTPQVEGFLEELTHTIDAAMKP